LSLDSQGNVWTFGANENGELGLGNDNKPQYNPTLIPNLSNIISVSAGHFHGIVLDSSGCVWSFGSNSSLQLGMEGTLTQGTPCKVERLCNIVNISSGNYHNLVLDSFGTVWSFGRNSLNQLGIDNSIIRESSLEKVPGLERISRVNCGGNSSCAVDYLHRIFVFGSNSSNQFDLENHENDTLIPTEQQSWRNKHVRLGPYHSIVIDEQGNVFFYGVLHRKIPTGLQDFQVTRIRKFTKSAMKV
jgi:alpha-tubulin suppressor-like RCC1 family protein